MGGIVSFRGRKRELFRILGVAQILLWTVFAFLSREFAYGTVSEERPFHWLGAVTGLAFVCYLLTILPMRAAVPGVNAIRGREVILFAILMRLPLLLFSHPVQEIDFYRYLWDGRVLLSGVSPYHYSPAEIDALRDTRMREEPGVTLPGEAARLLAVQDNSVAVRTIFDRIDHRVVPTIYPVVSQVVFASAALLTPESAALAIHRIIIRAIITGFDLGIVVLLLLLLKKLALPAGLAVAYAWCPLVLKEFANASHMDAIAVFFTVAAFYCFVRAVVSLENEDENGSGGSRRILALSGILLVLAIFSKWYPVVLVPVFLAGAWRRWRRFILPALVPGLLLTIVLFGLSRAAAPTGNELSGLRTFLNRWEMNDLLFSFVRENLRVVPADVGADSAVRPETWYAWTPVRLRQEWAFALTRAGIPAEKVSPDFLGAQLVCGGLLALVVGGLSLRLAAGKGDLPHEIGRTLFLVLAASWYLSATQNPWYWIWALPFVVFARSRVWLAVSGFALIYYARFWMIYRFPQPFWRDYTGQRFFDEIVTWAEHFPVLLALLFIGARSISRKISGNKRPLSALSPDTTPQTRDSK